MNNFEAQILTPEGSLFNDRVTGVQVPGSQGSFEIRTLHAAIISTLEIGPVLVRGADGEEHMFAVSGGFVEVHDNKLTLLAEAAEPVGKIDLERARKAKARALERISSEEKSIDRERARSALKRAGNRIRLAGDFQVSGR